MYNPEHLSASDQMRLLNFDYRCTDPREVTYSLELSIYGMWLTTVDMVASKGQSMMQSKIQDNRQLLTKEYARAIVGESSVFDAYAVLPALDSINWDLYGADKFVPLQKYDERKLVHTNPRRRSGAA